MYRVVFPFELKLGNTSENCNATDSVYNLFAVVVHIGSGMNHGRSTFACSIAESDRLLRKSYVVFPCKCNVFCCLHVLHTGNHGFVPNFAVQLF